MVGCIVKYANLNDNIFVKLFNGVDYHKLKIVINYWESYGDEFEKTSIMSSSFFKNRVLRSNNCYPEFCELFIRNIKNKDCIINNYGDFVESDYFLSITIIDRRNIELCFKNNKIVDKILSNINENIKGEASVVFLDQIDFDAILSCWRGKVKGINN